jgi:hypothetical protein
MLMIKGGICNAVLAWRQRKSRPRIGASIKSTLRNADRNGRVEKISPGDSLPLKKRVLDVMPELDSERDHPPGVRPPLKSFVESPDAGEHNQRVEVVKQF